DAPGGPLGHGPDRRGGPQGPPARGPAGEGVKDGQDSPFGCRNPAIARVPLAACPPLSSSSPPGPLGAEPPGPPERGRPEGEETKPRRRLRSPHRPRGRPCPGREAPAIP